MGIPGGELSTGGFSDSQLSWEISLSTAVSGLMFLGSWAESRLLPLHCNASWESSPLQTTEEERA